MLHKKRIRMSPPDVLSKPAPRSMTLKYNPFRGMKKLNDWSDGHCLVTYRPLTNTLEEEMAAHTSVLAQEIPWTEEPDGLHSRGRRIGHN